mmetsp:Transcript_94851/g.237896  ORF Transcript_94851/g.237896 Transcript_94851/m.237896 type:complete len:313 (-) Transcript_94851:56-994(-)
MHLLKGNYGPHVGGARGQDCPTSAHIAHHTGSAVGSRSIHTGACGLRPSVGVPDADDVDDILQQVRKDVKAIQQQGAGGRDQELDGRWAIQGAASPAFMVISGGVLQSPDGDEEQSINFTAPGKFFVALQGQRLDGELAMNEIHWANGEVWLRAQDASAAVPTLGSAVTATSSGSRRPAPVVKQLSRSYSEATWDRPRTRETQDVEVPRPMPKATVRGRYVFSGGVEPQAFTGLPGQLGRPEYGDELASQFSPRPVGGSSGGGRPGGGHSGARSGSKDHQVAAPPAFCTANQRQHLHPREVPELAEAAECEE